MGIKLFLMYFIVTGCLAVIRHNFIMNNEPKTGELRKKKQKLEDKREEMISDIYVMQGGDKDKIRESFYSTLPILIFLTAWLLPIIIVSKFIKCFIKGLTDEQR